MRAGTALSVMGRLLAHRGPDGSGEWLDSKDSVGLVHRRLAIIDLSPSGAQPMQAPNETVISLKGEIYNYVELRESLSTQWDFRSKSDTETVLAAVGPKSPLDRRVQGVRIPAHPAPRDRVFCV